MSPINHAAGVGAGEARRRASGAARVGHGARAVLHGANPARARGQRRLSGRRRQPMVESSRLSFPRDPLAGYLGPEGNVVGVAVVARYEIVHAHFMVTLTRSGWEWPLLKRMGRRLVVHYRGCEIRDRALNQRLHPEVNICQECDYRPRLCEAPINVQRRRWRPRTATRSWSRRRTCGISCRGAARAVLRDAFGRVVSSRERTRAPSDRPCDEPPWNRRQPPHPRGGPPSRRKG